MAQVVLKCLRMLRPGTKEVNIERTEEALADRCQYHCSGLSFLHDHDDVMGVKSKNKEDSR